MKELKCKWWLSYRQTVSTNLFGRAVFCFLEALPAGRLKQLIKPIVPPCPGWMKRADLTRLTVQWTSCVSSLWEAHLEERDVGSLSFKIITQNSILCDERGCWLCWSQSCTRSGTLCAPHSLIMSVCLSGRHSNGHFFGTRVILYIFLPSHWIQRKLPYNYSALNTNI